MIAKYSKIMNWESLSVNVNMTATELLYYTTAWKKEKKLLEERLQKYRHYADNAISDGNQDRISQN